MRPLLFVAVLATAAQAEPIAHDGPDVMNEARNEIGLGGVMPVKTRGLSSGAGFRLLAARMWSHLGLRFEYDLIGAGIHEIHRYGYLHRGGAALRLKAPWYRERRGRFDAYLDVGGGRQAIRWRDGNTDWRWDFAIGAGVRFDGILRSGHFIGYGLGVLVITAPATQTAAPRSTLPRDTARDVAVYLAFESVL